jgi:hypothetical protein
MQNLGVLLRRKTLGLAILNIDLGKPLACFDKLNYVEDLLNGHDGEADAGQSPGDRRIHLVCTGELQSRCAERVGEDLTKKRAVDRGSRLDATATVLHRLDQMRGEKRRREGKQVEGDEKELVQGANAEENVLSKKKKHC